MAFRTCPSDQPCSISSCVLALTDFNYVYIKFIQKMWQQGLLNITLLKRGTALKTTRDLVLLQDILHLNSRYGCISLEESMALSLYLSDSTD